MNTSWTTKSVVTALAVASMLSSCSDTSKTDPTAQPGTLVEVISESSLGENSRALTEKYAAIVEAVDRRTGVVTLRGPERTVHVQVSDRAQLQNIKAGDQVEATFTEGIVTAIEPATM